MNQPTGAAFSRICTMPSEVKALTDDADGARYVEGIASSGALDRHGEVVNQVALHRAFQGAFARTGKGLPYLRDHWTWNVIGKVVDFSLDGDRVVTRAKLLPPGKSQAADELFNILEADIPLSQSIGFNPLPGRNAWDFSRSGGEDDDGVWHWGGPQGDKDFDLLELSAVTIGANMDADLQLGKSLGLAMDRPWLRKEDRIIAGVALADLEDPEELRFYDDLDRALKALIGIDNIARHWLKEGRALSPETLEALMSPIISIADVLKAGRVLSDRNREAVIAAKAALDDVLARDDASRSRGQEDAMDDGEGTKEAASTLTAFGRLLLGK